jgi:hypothetical protein
VDAAEEEWAEGVRFLLSFFSFIIFPFHSSLASPLTFLLLPTASRPLVTLLDIPTDHCLSSLLHLRFLHRHRRPPPFPVIFLFFSKQVAAQIEDAVVVEDREDLAVAHEADVVEDRCKQLETQRNEDPVVTVLSLLSLPFSLAQRDHRSSRPMITTECRMRRYS